ncbi:amidohydrolase [Paenibacillus sp. UNCCL117]|uniref:M20 metallopeptidase family protein n=1 Tax=unclassified Paenibacillus TaxID=185978 RepID=UPI000882CB05|nr:MULTISPECIES: M20 family metallopeptidase [unclassified Paenibacillus]SDC89422.1 amidohydrolase [Paenibacillus sp. cl123]SFW28548.1 amidohydrolase [Paenibacillus sp. UNCCL117]
MAKVLSPELAAELRTYAEGLLPELVELRRTLHRYPETAFEEVRTAELAARLLREAGLEVTTGVGRTGVVGELRGASPGPTVALRADMDALPIGEETGLPFASERDGLMHACGHDVHTTILIGAARLLAAHRHLLAGTVRFIVQPAEEINAGAKAMLEDGVLDNVDAIYALHNLPTLAAGQIAVLQGPMMGSVDRIELTIEGKGGHGAIPDQSIDPIVAASAIVMGLQTAVSREISPFDSAVVTIGSLQAGEANNVIPHRAVLTGTVRTFSPKVQELMPDRLTRIVRHIAEAYRCKAELRYIPQTPVLAGADACVERVGQVARDLFGERRLQEARPTMAGEDFAVFLQHVPGSLFWLGSGPAEEAEKAFGLHHPKFVVDEACLVEGVLMMAGLALEETANPANARLS